MKHILILAVLASLATTTTIAQSKGTLHLSAGGALPIGNYASKDAGNPKSGMANLGGLAELSYSLPLKKIPNLGFTIGIRGRLNPIDENANTRQFRETYPALDWSATNSHYKTIAAMVGMYYDLPLQKDGKFDIHFEIDLGAAKCIIPNYTVLGLYDTAHTGATGYIQAQVHTASVITFSAAAKTGLIYHLNKKCQLFANLDFWYSDANFAHLTQTAVIVPQLVVPGVISVSNAASPPTYNQLTNPYHQPMNSLNLSFGIGYNL